MSLAPFQQLIHTSLSKQWRIVFQLRFICGLTAKQNKAAKKENG